MKSAVLSHVQSLFDEMEKEMALSHQEKYALLEDALENATDLISGTLNTLKIWDLKRMPVSFGYKRWVKRARIMAGLKLRIKMRMETLIWW